MYKKDTIAAVATPPGVGALGIVRISGPESLEQVDRVFKNPGGKRAQDLRGYTAAYGKIIDPETGEAKEEVVILVMRQPHSYTGEDMVEIIGHGGPLPLRTVLDLLLEGGVRLADRGEFTQRAFFNGKIDLAQAEAVLDVIEAKTDKGLKQALNQLQGSVSRFISESRNDLFEILAFCEASIDFPEDEIEELSPEEIEKRLKKIEIKLKEALDTFTRGQALREGVKTTIVGRPNVGKSTLLNALLGEDRALVTSVPGTTRDSVEEMINLDGIPLRLIDTAGLRDTEDEVEKLGVARTKKLLEESDLVIAVLDSTTGFTREDEAILESLPGEKSLVVVNKIDLEEKLDFEGLKKFWDPEDIFFISAREGKGLDKVRQAIFDRIIGSEEDEGFLITNLRHERALKEARTHVQMAIESWKQGVTMDLLVVDLRGAINQLGKITGETVSQDISREIFSRFCIGK